MVTVDDLEGTTLQQRLVLLALVDLDRRDATPANEIAVRDRCDDCLDDVDADVVGRPSAVDVTRTLNELAATDLVSESLTEPSATGKGRPEYETTVPSGELLEELAGDDRVSDVVADLRDGEPG